ncbi:hypothetical protein QUB05_31805 [Microcoleus sp. F10-C6]
MLKVKEKLEFSRFEEESDKGMESYLWNLKGLLENASGLGKVSSCKP